METNKRGNNNQHRTQEVKGNKHGTKFAFSQQTPPSKMSFWRSLSLTLFLSTKCQINLGRRSHFSNHKEVGHYGIRLIKIKRADSIQCAFHSISAIFSERSPSAA